MSASYTMDSLLAMEIEHVRRAARTGRFIESDRAVYGVDVYNQIMEWRRCNCERQAIGVSMKRKAKRGWRPGR